MRKNLAYALKADVIDRRTSIKAIGESVLEAKKCLIMGLPMLLCSCRLDVKENPLVAKFFEEDIFKKGVFEKSIKEGYQYNQDRFTNYPTAILKTERGRLDSNLWNCEIKDVLTMQQRVINMKTDAQQADNAKLYGADLFYKGQMLGEVYGFDSYLKSNPTVWLKEGNKFTIKTPGMMSSGGSSVSPSSSSTGGSVGGGGSRGGTK